MTNPFILTAKLPAEVHSWADDLRRTYFPPERKHLHAHITLFHSFAPSLLDELKSFLPQIVVEFAPPSVEITGLLDLGKGTAIALQSPALLELRSIISEHFHGSLTDQDLHTPRLHITIQNKVSKDEARALQASLSPTIEPRGFEIPAFELHRYLGGPWELVKTFAFRGREQI